MLRVLLCLLAGLLSSTTQAHEARWLLQTSVYSAHYSPEPDHNNHQRLIGLEYTRDNDWLVGGASFQNSFSQRSAYVYTGRRFDFASGPLFAKVTGGLLHGYRGEHNGKIPFNEFGIAPAIIPSLGLQAKALTSELVFLGAAAIMVNVGVQF